MATSLAAATEGLDPPASLISPTAASQSSERKTMIVTPDKDEVKAYQNPPNDSSKKAVAVVVDGKEDDVKYLQQELAYAKGDAEATLQALVQFAEGVRLITRHMHHTTTKDDGDNCREEKKEESKEEAESVSDPFLSLESFVASSKLQGTVFGTDLMKLYDAASHVEDYARMVTEESSLSAADILEARQVAKKATQKTQRLEQVSRQLLRQNRLLRRQVAKLNTERQSLIREVKGLREHMATNRKLEMERLLQQHVVGALLLHESQLKTMTVLQQERETKRQQRKMQEEEKVEEDDDMELIQAEDCQEEEARFEELVEKADEDDTEAASSCDSHPVGDGATRNTTGNDVVTTKASKEKSTNTVNTDNSESVKAQSDTDVGVSSECQSSAELKEESSEPHSANKENKAANQTTKEASSTDGVSKPKEEQAEAKAKTKATMKSLSSSYAPVKLLPSFGSVSHTLPASAPRQSDKQRKPDSSRSINSAHEGSQENVGTKVFDFFFRPEKIGQQRQLEALRQQQQQQKAQQTDDNGDKPMVESEKAPLPVTALPKTKYNPLIKALDCEEGQSDEKDAVSVDATAPTMAATTPTSSCAESRSKVKKASTAKKEKGQMCAEQEKTVSCVIPSCVSFSDCIISVQSNLNSPMFQDSPGGVSLGDDSTSNIGAASEGEAASANVSMYKDFKVFQSLSIPTDDDIDDYRQYQGEQQLLLKQKPSVFDPTVTKQ